MSFGWKIRIDILLATWYMKDWSLVRWNSEWLISDSNKSGGTRWFSPCDDAQLLLSAEETEDVDIDGTWTAEIIKIRQEFARRTKWTKKKKEGKSEREMGKSYNVSPGFTRLFHSVWHLALTTGLSDIQSRELCHKIIKLKAGICDDKYCLQRIIIVMYKYKKLDNL